MPEVNCIKTNKYSAIRNSQWQKNLHGNSQCKRYAHIYDSGLFLRKGIIETQTSSACVCVCVRVHDNN